jgi:CRP/FNR family cyclic AMP-dependent transcriptional regulator
MKLINPLNHPHSGKAAILIAIAIVLGITIHEVFFLIALLIAAIACMEWGAHEVHVIHELHERKTHSQPQSAPLATRVAVHPFLAGMSRTHLALLTDCAIAAHFEKRQTILREGEFANGVYLIESGEVVLESGEESGEPVVVDTIGPGDPLGWSWMFPPYIWRFTARAVEPIDAIFFYGTTLREYCEKDHSLGYELLKRTTLVMLRRLQATRDRLLSVLQELDTYENENEGKDRIHFQAIKRENGRMHEDRRAIAT